MYSFQASQVQCWSVQPSNCHEAARERHTAATRCNDRSSRSHAVFQLLGGCSFCVFFWGGDGDGVSFGRWAVTKGSCLFFAAFNFLGGWNATQLYRDEIICRWKDPGTWTNQYFMVYVAVPQVCMVWAYEKRCHRGRVFCWSTDGAKLGTFSAPRGTV